MSPYEFAEHGAIVGGDGEVPAFEELFLFEARPFAVDPAALHRAAYGHHETAVAVVGAGIAVLFRSTAEFGHGYQDDVFHAIAHVLAERADGIRKLTKQIRELLILVAVVIPSTHFGESGLDSGLCFDQTCKLLQTASEVATELLDTESADNTPRRRLILRTTLDRLDHLHRVKRIFTGAAERRVRRPGIHG